MKTNSFIRTSKRVKYGMLCIKKEFLIGKQCPTDHEFANVVSQWAQIEHKVILPYDALVHLPTYLRMLLNNASDTKDAIWQDDRRVTISIDKNAGNVYLELSKTEYYYTYC